MMDKSVLHRTKLGTYYNGDSVALLQGRLGKQLQGKVQLILTSPPFPLNNKKSYGNLKGVEYRKWFASLAPIFANLLKEDGSIVIEIGNAWEAGRPVQSLLHLQSLMDFVAHQEAGLRLCQQSVCYNPARLPSPAPWVTIKRIRLTDSFTHVWWFAKSDYPKADNQKVLRPYGGSMKKLLKRQSYNAGQRPSAHDISETSFLKDHKGSISPNFFEVEPINEGDEPRLPNAFKLANTSSSDFFQRTCRERGIKPHPARMQEGLAAFYTEFLTDEGDIVLDPFAGSNTTGYVAESLGRRWVSIEMKEEFAEQAKLRFKDPALKKK